MLKLLIAVCGPAGMVMLILIYFAGQIMYRFILISTNSDEINI